MVSFDDSLSELSKETRAERTAMAVESAIVPPVGRDIAAWAEYCPHVCAVLRRSRRGRIHHSVRGSLKMDD